MIVGLLAASGAAVCYGSASVLQALGARHVAGEYAVNPAVTSSKGNVHSGLSSEDASVAPSSATVGAAATARTTTKTITSAQFLCGMVLDALGFLLGATAARGLPLFLCQTIISANLVVTALLAMRLLHLRLHRRDWTAISAVCLGLVLLAAAAGPEGDVRGRHSAHWWLLGVAVLMVIAGGLAARKLKARGSIVAGLLSGLGFGIVGIGVRVLFGLSPFRLSEVLADPALYAIGVGGVGGVYLYAVALQLGAVTAAAAATVVGETLIPGVIGVVWLGDGSRPGFAWAAALGFMMAVAGAIAVSRFAGIEAAPPAS